MLSVDNGRVNFSVSSCSLVRYRRGVSSMSVPRRCAESALGGARDSMPLLINEERAPFAVMPL